jgi:hypothetical protein
MGTNRRLTTPAWGTHAGIESCRDLLDFRDAGRVGASTVRRLWPARARVAAVAIAVLAAAPIASCSGADAAGACATPRREALDPNLSHVLGTGAEPVYLTDPPTSGPHQPTRALSGVQTEPIPKPVQVGLLEAGTVILQHTVLDADQRAALEALAGTDVVVAPADELPAPIVATAWLYKQTCKTVDATVLRAFVTAHAGKGPGSDG